MKQKVKATFLEEQSATLKQFFILLLKLDA